MAFSTNNTLDMMMALNCFGPQFDPQSIPSYIDWVANTTFDPFGPEPFASTSHPVPGTRLHLQSQVDTGSRVHPGCGPSEGMASNFPQERSRFAFAQKRIERRIDVSAGQIPAAHIHNSSLGRFHSSSPVPIRTALAKPSRVAGPRPLRSQRAPRARREPILATPKPVYPLPMWLTHFEDYEQELLAHFCPPSQNSSPSSSTFPATITVRLPSDHTSDCPPLSTFPLLGFENSGYTDTEVGGTSRGGDEDGDEEYHGYHSSEFDTDSDLGSESSTSEGYAAWAIDCSARFQGQVGSDGYSSTGAMTDLEFPPPYTPSPPPSSFGSFDLAAQLPNFLPWSIFTNPFTNAPITASPAPSPTVPAIAYHPAYVHTYEVDVDRSLAKVEEGFGSGSGSLPEPTVVDTEGLYDRNDLTGYTFPILSQQPQSPLIAAGFEVPPLAHTGTIPLPDMEESEDAELDTIVIPRGPWYWWW